MNVRRDYCVAAGVFEVGFVLLIPIAFNVAKVTNKSLLLIWLADGHGLFGHQADFTRPRCSR